MVTLTKHVISGPGFTFRRAPALKGFLPNINEDQKSPTIWGQGAGTEPYGKYGAGYCIKFIKSLDEGLR